MIQHFMASTINCGCHSIRSMFRVLGIYNFGLGQKHVENFVGFLGNLGILLSRFTDL